MAEKKKRIRKKIDPALEEAREQRRTLANPQTTEEADTQLPPFEKQLGLNMTEREIISHGSLLDKIKLYCTLWDYSNYFGSTTSSPDTARESVQASILTQADKDVVDKCVSEFSALQVYGQKVLYYFKRFQSSFCVLAKFIIMWESYEREAANLTAIFKRWKKKDPKAAEWLVNDIIKFAGDPLQFDREGEKFFVDVDRPSFNLYKRLIEEVGQTERDLADFKAYAVAIEEYISGKFKFKSTLNYLPISIQTNIDNAIEERYIRYVINNLAYFRSNLSARRSRGETITPADERRAVIPDYWEVEPTQEVYDNCVDWLKLYLGQSYGTKTETKK